MKINKSNCILLISMLLFLIVYPALGRLKLDDFFQLSGVTSEIQKPQISLVTLMRGDYQNSLADYIHDHIPGRNLLVRLHNQLLYSCLRVSSNENVVIGKNKQLYEPEYIDYSLNLSGQPTEDEIQALIDKLEQLQQLMTRKNKELYIFITPAKTRYYKQQIPEIYQKFDRSQETDLAYDSFIRMLKSTDLNYYDSISYINEHQSEFQFPLWYSTGIHWSRALGYTVAADFNRFMCTKSKYDLGQILVSYKKTTQCIAPDADLYNLLNLLLPSKNEYYDVQFQTQEGRDMPSVFYRGGSFMGQSLNQLIYSHIFGENVHFENNYYFTDYYQNYQTISDFDAYDELDVLGYLDQSDVLILEVNEEKIHTMSWGFIDYILSNYK